MSSILSQYSAMSGASSLVEDVRGIAFCLFMAVHQVRPLHLRLEERQQLEPPVRLHHSLQTPRATLAFVVAVVGVDLELVLLRALQIERESEMHTEGFRLANSCS